MLNLKLFRVSYNFIVGLAHLSPIINFVSPRQRYIFNCSRGMKENKIIKIIVSEMERAGVNASRAIKSLLRGKFAGRGIQKPKCFGFNADAEIIPTYLYCTALHSPSQHFYPLLRLREHKQQLKGRRRASLELSWESFPSLQHWLPQLCRIRLAGKLKFCLRLRETADRSRGGS